VDIPGFIAPAHEAPSSSTICITLNVTLTVAATASHQKAGWENLPIKSLQTYQTKKENLVFILWGKICL